MPCIFAAAAGREEVIEWLLGRSEVDVDMEARDRSLKTPLHWAAAYGHAATMKLPFKRGADIWGE
ncbi:hypothetical protein LZ30DRAFT_601093 [Colletotrichum cereale]|nr:hypothetical protein LZ30DRAFT_601093 [Colletotrichum cereale]